MAKPKAPETPAPHDPGAALAKTIDMSGYLALQQTKQELAEIITDNLGVGGISAFDLDRVKVPTGGALQWAVPSLDGVDTVKALEGVIVLWTQPRARWESSLENGGRKPPVCTSEDGIVGVGNPGGSCASCRYNQFGTAAKGGGKACKERRMLFMLNPDSLLPMVVQIPATSIKPIRQYLMRLASAGLPYYAVVTKLALVSTRNAGGIDFGIVTPERVGTLNPEDKARLKDYSDRLKPVLVRAVSALNQIPDDDDLDSHAAATVDTDGRGPASEGELPF